MGAPPRFRTAGCRAPPRLDVVRAIARPQPLSRASASGHWGPQRRDVARTISATAGYFRRNPPYNTRVASCPACLLHRALCQNNDMNSNPHMYPQLDSRQSRDSVGIRVVNCPYFRPSKVALVRHLMRHSKMSGSDSSRFTQQTQRMALLATTRRGRQSPTAELPKRFS